MKKKLLRIPGYIICGLLIVLSVILIFASAAFGAEKTVSVFGYNIYLVENDDIPTAPEGSAVLVRKTTPDTLTEGKLVLYMKDVRYADGTTGEPEPVLGYVKSTEARDGVFYITVAYHGEPFDFISSDLVGSADYSSRFFGNLLHFVRTPIGIMVIAVLPCAALILFEIIRAAYKNRPEPEVVPRVKNADEEDEQRPYKGLSVNSDGKAAYSRTDGKPVSKDASVLYTYGSDKRLAGKQQKTSRSESQRPIIPLTDKKPSSASPAAKPAPANRQTSAASAKTGRLMDIKIPPEALAEAISAQLGAESLSKAPRAESLSGSRPESHSDSQHENRSKAPLRLSPSPLPDEDGDTAEIPEGSLSGDASGQDAAVRKSEEAFFAQKGINSAAPVGRQSSAPQIGGKARSATETLPKLSGKRSAQILASKGYDDLLYDDEDDYPRSSKKRDRDKALDEIFAGMERKKR